MPTAWTVRGATFALWLAAAACAGFWGLRLGKPPAVDAPVAGAGRAPVVADPVAIARLLGGEPAAPGLAAAVPQATLASRFQLVGVAAGARSGGGAAIISVDGKPGKPFRVGSVLEEGLVLQAVQGRHAILMGPATGARGLVLELPPFRVN